MNEPKVRRVQRDDYLSDVDPPMDPNAREVDKLAWLAAVVAMDSGVDLEVTVTERPRRRGRSEYTLSWRGGSVSQTSFASAWSFLLGMGAGLSAAKVKS